MTRRIYLLNGLAILAVVLNHAAGWGQVAMFLWTDRYRPVSVPSWDQLGSLGYYSLLAVRQLTQLAVPVFIFVSGFFIAYAGRGQGPVSVWRAAKTRVVSLLIPYLIWSLVIAAGDAMQGIVYRPLEYLVRLATNGVVGPYYFVPLLCYLYLLSPLVVRVARARPRLLLCICASIQLGTVALSYLQLFRIDISVVQVVVPIMAPWLPTKWIPYFALGAVAGLHTERVEHFLGAHRSTLLLLSPVAFALCLVESDLTLRTMLVEWGISFGAVSFHLYSLSFILWYLSSGAMPYGFPAVLRYLSRHSFGVYLLHITVMEFFARVVRQLAPWVLAYQVPLFFPLMLGLGLGMPLLAMVLVQRSPARKAYAYLFG